MKKFNLLKRMLLTCLILASFGIANAQVFSGTGTVADPFLIDDREDLLTLDEVWGTIDTIAVGTDTTFYAYKNLNFLQTANITMLATDTLTPIGDENVFGTFNGTYDGGSHTITGLITRPSMAQAGNTGVGLFGFINGTIKNLGIIDIITSRIDAAGTGKSQNGTLCGRIGGNALIYNCFVFGGELNAKGSWGTGGLVAVSWGGGRISNCFVKLDKMEAGYGTVGIFGMKMGGEVVVDSCIFYGQVTAGAGVAIAPEGVTQTNNYYIENSGANDDALATKLAAIEMIDEANLNLDFSTIWAPSTVGGFPVLKSFESNVGTLFETFKPSSTPIANAGANQSVMGTVQVTLDASASIANNASETVTYDWNIIGNAPELSSETVEKPTFTAPDVTSITTYQYELIVDNQMTTSLPDTVNIIISPYVDVQGDTLERSFWTVIDATSDAGNLGGIDGRKKMLDNDPTTNWASEWDAANWSNPADQKFPIYFTVDMKRTASVEQIIWLPRQGDGSANGHPVNYEVYFSTDNENWGTAYSNAFIVPAENAPVDEFKLTKFINLDKEYEARYIKFVAKDQATPSVSPQVCFAEFIPVGIYTDLELEALTASAEDDKSASVGEETTLEVTATTDARLTATYMWEGPDFISLSGSTTATPSFTTDSIGEHMFYVTVNDGNSEPIMDSIKVTVSALSTVTVTISVINDGEPVDGADVTFGTTIGTTNTNGEATFDEIPVGQYVYSVDIDIKAIDDVPVEITKDTTIIVDFDASGINELAAQSVKCYPNPATDVITISSIAAISSVNVYTITGRLVYSATAVNSLEKEINVEAFGNGIYFTEIKGEGFTKTLKVVVE